MRDAFGGRQAVSIDGRLREERRKPNLQPGIYGVYSRTLTSIAKTTRRKSWLYSVQAQKGQDEQNPENR